MGPLDKRKRRDAITEYDIKLTRALKNDLVSGTALAFEPSRNRDAMYRPFLKKRLHFWSRLNEMQYQLNHLFPTSEPNPTLTFRCVFSNDALATLAVDKVYDYGLVKTGNGGTDSLPRYRYTKSGERLDNITDWAVAQFVAAYAGAPLLFRGGAGGGVSSLDATVDNAAKPHPNPSPEEEGLKKIASAPEEEGVFITKDAIFAYCYAVLHDPLYRTKYALNLKREFPRIPFYPDFAQWAAWGEALLKLHIDYEQVKPAKLTRIETPNPKRAEGTQPKPKLKSSDELGQIQIDEDTQLTGIPLEAWHYRLGNRSAIDWVLDQHKEKTPRDPTIRAKFNTYRFADYKEPCIELLRRVVTVSVETVRVTEAMKNLDRSSWE